MPPSDVWRHFTKQSKNEAKCNTCGKVVKTSGNTSNLKAHLKFHMLKDDLIHDAPTSKRTGAAAATKNIKCGTLTKLSSWAKVPNPDNKAERTSVKSALLPVSTEMESVPGTSGTSPMSSSTAPIQPTSPLPSGVQPSIVQSFGVIKKFAEGGSRSCNITQGLLYFICKDGMPLSLVDGEGFKRLMKEAVPLYKVPTRNTVKEMINRKFQLLSADFKTRIQTTIDQFTITTDVWSNMMTTMSFLGVTVHFIEETSIESVNLGVSELKQSHTADYLGSQILSVLEDWGISKEKITCVVTDNEAAMVKAVKDTFGKNKHVPCLAHCVNLLAEKATTKTPGLSDLIKKIREIVKFIKRSVNASDQLRQEQKIRGILEGEVLKMVLDVQTRWNSMYYMVERFLVLSNIVSSVLISNSKPDTPPMLTSAELETAKEVKHLMSFLERLTRELSGENYVTGSMAIPLLNCFLQSITSTSPKQKLGIDLKASLMQEFNERFQDREQVHLLALPMFLDPRFKNIHFLDSTSSARSLNQIKKLVAAISEKNAVFSDSESEMEIGDDPADLWSHHKTLALKTTKKMAASQSTSAMDLDSEIALYLSTPVAANHKANPLELWSDLKNVYPKLYLLARQYLCVLATSVPAERLFSKAGNTLTEKRNRLNGKLVSKLLFLNGLPSKYWK